MEQDKHRHVIILGPVAHGDAHCNIHWTQTSLAALKYIKTEKAINYTAASVPLVLNLQLAVIVSSLGIV